MLNSQGFDLWANDYDRSVGVTDDDNEYPFAGYKGILNAIYGAIMARSPAKVLDIGLGTGTLAAKLCAENEITGIDFSGEMLKIARERMPGARLIEHDFSTGLPESLRVEKFDCIVSTYALHHLTDDAKVSFILALLDALREGGIILIGDISFPTKDDLDRCREDCGEDEWDSDEYYFVYSEMQKALAGKCETQYHRFSHCGGILEIRHL